MSFLCLCIRQKKVGGRAVHWGKSNKWNVHLFVYMKFFLVLFCKQTEEGTVERPCKASVRLVHKTFLLSSLPLLWWNACASGNGFTAATRHGPWFSLDSQNIWTTLSFNFPCSFATTSPIPPPTRVACMDTKNLHREVMYKRFYYISLIKAGLYSSFGPPSLFGVQCQVSVFHVS